MRILVTGSAGFIGSHLVDALLKKRHQVFGIDDLSGGFERNINPKSIFFEHDLREKLATERIIRKIRPEIFFHLAADATEGRSQFTPIECTQRNYLATLNLLVAGIKHKMRRFVFTSSMAVYGAQKPPFKENMRPEPEDLYGISKAASENAIEILARVHGFKYAIVRPHNVYGPKQNMADPYRNVVAIFINKLLKKEPFYIYGDGEQKRAFSYIDDVIPSLVKCGFLPEADSQIFNLGSDTPHTVNELAQKLISISGANIKPKYLPARPQEVKLAFSDHQKAKMVLKFKEKTFLKEGLQKVWEWAEKIGPQKPVYLDKLELINKNTPITWKRKLI